MTTQHFHVDSGSEALGWLVRRLRAYAGLCRTQVELSSMKQRDLDDIGLRVEPVPYW